MKFVPLMVTLVPPVVRPLDGEMLVTVGAGIRRGDVTGPLCVGQAVKNTWITIPQRGRRYQKKDMQNCR